MGLLLVFIWLMLIVLSLGLREKPYRMTLSSRSRVFQKVEERVLSTSVDDDLGEEIARKQAQIREERRKRVESNPLVFGVHDTVWSLSDTFGVNSTLVRVIFSAIEDATQLFTKAEVGFSSFSQILQSKIEMDIKTTQRALDYFSRKATRDARGLTDTLPGLGTQDTSLGGGEAGNSSVTALALMRAGVNPFESGRQARLLPSVAASTTGERALRVRQKRRSIPPALVADTQEQYRTMRTLPSKLAYDFDRKKANSPSSTGSDTLCTIMNALPTGLRPNLVTGTLLPSSASDEDNSLMAPLPMLDATIIPLDAPAPEAPVPSPARASRVPRAHVSVDPALSALEDFDLLNKAAVELKWVLDTAGRALVDLKNEIHDEFDTATNVVETRVRPGSDWNADTWARVEALQELCVGVRVALRAAGDLADVVCQQEPLWRNEEMTMTMPLSGAPFIESHQDEEGSIANEQEMESEVIQRQIAAISSLVDGMLLVLGDLESGPISGWCKTVEHRTRLQYTIHVFAAVKDVFQPVVESIQGMPTRASSPAASWGQGKEVVPPVNVNVNSVPMETAVAAAPSPAAVLKQEQEVASSVLTEKTGAADDEEEEFAVGFDVDAVMEAEARRFEEQFLRQNAENDHPVSTDGGDDDDGADIVHTAVYRPVKIGKRSEETDRKFGGDISEVTVVPSITAPGAHGTASSCTDGDVDSVTIDTDAVEQDTSESAVVKFLVTALDVSLFFVESVVRAAWPLVSDGGSRALERVGAALRAAPRDKAKCKVQGWRLLSRLAMNSERGKAAD